MHNENRFLDTFRGHNTRPISFIRHFVSFSYLVPVFDCVGDEKLVLFIRLNANLGRVSRPDEIPVLLSCLFRRES